jgi:hypothetical protein
MVPRSFKCCDSECLTSLKSTPMTAVLSGIGGLLIGLIAGVLAAFVFLRQRWKKPRGPPLLDPMDPTGYMDPYTSQSLTSATTAHYRALPSHSEDPSSSTLSPSPSYMALQQMRRESTHYQIEPFILPGEQPASYNEASGEPHHAASASTSGPGGGGNIYVVHHDAGRAPVTVYHQDGTEVVELPPRYAGNDGPGEARPVSSIPTDGRTVVSGSYSVNDILPPSRRPNRLRKP